MSFIRLTSKCIITIHFRIHFVIIRVNRESRIYTLNFDDYDYRITSICPWPSLLGKVWQQMPSPYCTHHWM